MRLNEENVKPVEWIGNSLEDMQAMSRDVRRLFGFALYEAQAGRKHPSAKSLRGFKGASVLEIVGDYDTDTYRAVYTVRFTEAIYVLHVFQKKSKHGIATPPSEVAAIRRALTQAENRHEEFERSKNGEA